MTHAELVDRARRWLKAQGCSTIITHKFTNSWEEPDAIGWKGFGWSLLVECKVSRADFVRDADKPFRAHPGLGMGTQRVYLTPPGLIDPSDLPPLWGLVEVAGRAARWVRRPDDQSEKNWAAELKAVLALCRRVEGITRPLRHAGRHLANRPTDATVRRLADRTRVLPAESERLITTGTVGKPD